MTLKENNLREIANGRILNSQGVLVANRRSLLERPGLLAIVHELLERLEAHLKAEQVGDGMNVWVWVGGRGLGDAHLGAQPVGAGRAGVCICMPV